MFSVIDALLLRSLPFPDPQRLTMLWESDSHRPEADEVAPTNFFDWQKNSHSFASMGAAHPISQNLTGRGDATQIYTMNVTAGVLPTLGVHPQLGRIFDLKKTGPKRRR